MSSFYRHVLGFEVLWADEEGNYVSFKTGDVVLALNRQDSMAVEDVDAVYHQLRERGVIFITDPLDRSNWGMRTAHFRDPDGNLIEINSALPVEDG